MSSAIKDSDSELRQRIVGSTVSFINPIENVVAYSVFYIFRISPLIHYKSFKDILYLIATTKYIP